MVTFFMTRNKKELHIMKLFFVPGTGIEPAHSCERQILSLLRLPIPPPGPAFLGFRLGLQY